MTDEYEYDDVGYKVTIVDVVDTGVTCEGHAAYDYLLENEAGERRWLRECILFEEGQLCEEDWLEFELAK